MRTPFWFLLMVAFSLSLDKSVALTEAAKDGKSDEPAWGMAAEGWRLSLRSDQAKYTVGQKLNLKVIMQNVDSKAMKLVRVRNVLGMFEFQVIGPDGKAVPTSERGKGRLDTAQSIASIVYDSVDPMKERSWELALHEIFDLKQPGKYEIVAGKAVRKQEDKKEIVKLSSNMLVIQIVEGKDDEKK